MTLKIEKALVNNKNNISILFHTRRFSEQDDNQKLEVSSVQCYVQ